MPGSAQVHATEGQDRPRPVRGQWVALRSLQLMLGVVFGVLGAEFFESGAELWFVIAYSYFACCSFLSALAGWGWLLPLTLSGFLVGYILDPNVKGGGHESQTWETIVAHAIGTGSGCGIGLIVDATQPRRRKVAGTPSVDQDSPHHR